MVNPEQQKQAQHLRDLADRLDRQGDHALAILVRNDAWCIENGHDWLNELTIRKVNRD